MALLAPFAPLTPLSALALAPVLALRPILLAAPSRDFAELIGVHRRVPSLSAARTRLIVVLVAVLRGSRAAPGVVADVVVLVTS